MIDKKQKKNVEYFDYSGSTTANDTEWNREFKSRITMAKAAVNKETLIIICLFFHATIANSLSLPTALLFYHIIVSLQTLNRQTMGTKLDVL